MEKELKGKIVVITGASSGFGEAMAEKFAEAGASLILIARNEARLQATENRVKERGGEVISLTGDVTETSTFERAREKALEKWSQVDILINNAGGGVKIGPLEEQSEATIKACLNLNLTSAINGCRIFVPQMKKQKSGLIMNITSVCEKLGFPGWSIYSAAKAGLSMFSRCLYTELRPEGIAVTVIVPGGSNTGFQKEAGIDNFDWKEEASLRPEHIAHAAYSVATLPAGAVMPEIIVYGMSQELVPF